MKPFEYIIEAHGPSVLRYLRSKVGPERSEDCFQETMLAALRAYGEVRDERAVRAWLFTIAGRKAIDMYRADSRAAVPDEAAGQAVDHRIASRPGSNDIWSVVTRLPEKQAWAVELRFRAGLTHREVGQVMEISESAARRNVFEGLKGLRADAGSWTDLTNARAASSERA